MKRRKTVWIMIGVLICVIAVSMTLIRLIPSTKAFDANDYTYDMAYSKELDNIPVIEQATSHTCAVVSMAIVKTHLGVSTSEREVLAELSLESREGGMLPNEYLAYANEVFAPMSYEAILLNPTTEAGILNIITDSIQNDLPVVIFYAAEDDWNAPHFNTHYAVLYGIDMPRGVVKASNPYGYLEELSFAELFDGLDYTSYPAKPLMFQLGRVAGMIKPNNLFIFSKVQ